MGFDLDGDARVDRIETIEKGRVTRVAQAAEPGSRPPRTVVIAIDAIPYEVFAACSARASFASSSPPHGWSRPSRR